MLSTVFGLYAALHLLTFQAGMNHIDSHLQVSDWRPPEYVARTWYDNM